VRQIKLGFSLSEKWALGDLDRMLCTAAFPHR
jgi:hypothetical protein